MLEQIIEGLHNVKPGELSFSKPFHFDEPSWVAKRIAEVLPLDLCMRKKPMESPDVDARITYKYILYSSAMPGAMRLGAASQAKLPAVKLT
ncbi:MAG: hypothetical protein V3Q69_13220 [Burkholderia sp.]